MITRETLYNVKQYDFYIHDNKQPSAVLKYTTKPKTNEIEHINVFINKECLEMMSVLNFTNIMHSIVVKGYNQSDIEKLYKQLKLSDMWQMKKQKILRNVGYYKIISLPYTHFETFTSRLKTETFNEIYKKYNIKIGEFKDE